MAKARAHLKKPYARILVPTEDGRFAAEVLEFPGCVSYGNTPEEAYRRLDDAAESWIEAAWAQRQQIPEPFASVDFGGKFALRMPRSLHRRAAQLAEKDRVSLNQFCVGAIAERVGAEDLMARFSERLTGTVTNVMAMIKITNNRNIITSGVLLQQDKSITGTVDFATHAGAGLTVVESK